MLSESMNDNIQHAEIKPLLILKSNIETHAEMLSLHNN